MKGIALITLGLTAGALLRPAPVSALTISPGGTGITLNSVAGTGTQANPVVVNGAVSGATTSLRINGLTALANLAGTLDASSFWIRLVLVNDTGTPWAGFDHELQTVNGVSSPDPDGLSFAQAYLTGARPWTSSAFGSFTEQTGSRDAITFSGGEVAVGGSVTFNYIISHSGDANPVYLQLRAIQGTPRDVPDALSTGWAMLGSAILLLVSFGWRRVGVS